MAEEMMTKAAAMTNTGRLTMVERVARAIYDAWASENEVTHTWDEMVAAVAISSAEDAPTLHRMHRLAFAEARAAIEVMREPTSAMVEAIKPWPEHWGSFEDADPVWKVAYWADQAAAASGFTTMINAALSEADHG